MIAALAVDCEQSRNEPTGAAAQASHADFPKLLDSLIGHAPPGTGQTVEAPLCRSRDDGNTGTGGGWTSPQVEAELSLGNTPAGDLRQTEARLTSGFVHRANATQSRSVQAMTDAPGSWKVKCKAAPPECELQLSSVSKNERNDGPHLSKKAERREAAVEPLGSDVDRASSVKPHITGSEAASAVDASTVPPAHSGETETRPQVGQVPHCTPAANTIGERALKQLRPAGGETAHRSAKPADAPAESSAHIDASNICAADRNGAAPHGESTCPRVRSKPDDPAKLPDRENPPAGGEERTRPSHPQRSLPHASRGTDVAAPAEERTIDGKPAPLNHRTEAPAQNSRAAPETDGRESNHRREPDATNIDTHEVRSKTEFIVKRRAEPTRQVPELQRFETLFAIRQPDADGLPSNSVRSDHAQGMPRYAELVNGLREKIVLMVRTGENRAVVKLHPPELGKIEIRLEVLGKECRAEIVVQNIGVKALVESHAPQLVQSLNGAGIELSDLFVALEQGSERQRFSNDVHFAHGRASNPAVSRWKKPVRLGGVVRLSEGIVDIMA